MCDMARESGEPIVLVVGGGLSERKWSDMWTLETGIIGYIFDGNAEVKECLHGLWYHGLVSHMAHRYHHHGVHSRKKNVRNVLHL